MIQLGFDGSDIRVQTILREKSGEIVAALLPAGDALMIRLQAHIVRDKLQGQVLHHRSGKLSASIRPIPGHAEGDHLVWAVEGAGGPAFYGKYHEMGETITARRHLKHPSHLIRRRSGTKMMTGTPYSIHFPLRSFMRTGAAEMRGEIEQTLIERINQVVRE